jgi:hypothetical protein
MRIGSLVDATVCLSVATGIAFGQPEATAKDRESRVYYFPAERP